MRWKLRELRVQQRCLRDVLCVVLMLVGHVPAFCDNRRFKKFEPAFLLNLRQEGPALPDKCISAMPQLKIVWKRLGPPLFFELLLLFN